MRGASFDEDDLDDDEDVVGKMIEGMGKKNAVASPISVNSWDGDD